MNQPMKPPHPKKFNIWTTISFNAIGIYKKIKRYLHNIFWIMGDKVIHLGVGFLITVIIARHLGPEDFGIFSYAISVASLFAVAGHMGLSGLIVREIVRKPDEIGITLGTALGLKLAGITVGYIALLGYAVIYEDFGEIELVALAIAGAAILFTPLDVIDFWFQARVQAKYATFARLSGLAVGAALKLAFVFLGLSTLYFLTANLAQSAVTALSLLIAYKIKSNIKSAAWNFSWPKAKELFGQGWLIYLGSFFAIINLKVDQVMLRWLEGPEAVGIYAVAVQLSEAWYFLPAAIVASFFPKLIKLKEENPITFNVRLQQLFDLLFTLALCAALLMTALSDRLVSFFFGDHYLRSASVLEIHTWAAIFIFMRAIFSKWILIENALIFSLITQGLGALINVILNYFWIPKHGAQGAAYATLISYALSSFFSLFIYRKTRPIFFMMLKSFFLPARIANIRKFR